MKHTVQIIGGNYRGKKISFTDAPGLRPTPNRVRETLFNWLMRDIRGAQCLDAFAGSGALGLEAFSRGASQVLFIEKHPAVFTNLHKVLSQFNTPSLSLLKIDALTYLHSAQNSAPFNLIFLDPPFADNLLQPCLDLLAKSSILAEEGLVYFESATDVLINENQWRQVHVKKAGQVIFGLLTLKTPAQKTTRS